MHDQPAARQVQDPIFDDSGSGVERGLDGEIESQGGVRDLYNEIQSFGCGLADRNPPEYSRFNTIKSG
jgi:hypothetical protein